MYVLLYHIWNIITGYPSIMAMASHLGHPYLESINIWYPTDQNARNFLVKFLANFKRKCVEISIIYECNLKIVKICQKCANFDNPNSTPRLPALPYLRTRTSRETQSLVSLDSGRFSSKAVQLFSPKRVNLLICWPSMALSWAHPRGPQPGSITITPIAGCA